MRLVHHQAAMIEKQSTIIEQQTAKVSQLLINDRLQSHLIDDMRNENKVSAVFIRFEHEIPYNKIYRFLLIPKYWNSYINIHGVVFWTGDDGGIKTARYIDQGFDWFSN